ncbi:response regulator transcription factor [Anoxybacterium hadale]|uniref:Response regulator transcription factor n=1 Tax=Anoxybacterium hadale TaxID=3408580 RepID=A0ACD1AEP4_9FIRM|nr:response regulator transcription factor [Clostridiales bacterium]
MRVAICDDQAEALELLQSRLEQNGRANVIDCYLSVKQLHQAISEGKSYDLLFMDIDWNQEKTGIDFAHSLNELCPELQIVFVTGHPDSYYQQIFLKHINLCGYMGKPIDLEILEKLMQKALSAIRTKETQQLLIQQQGISHAIPIHKIYYLESRGHQLTIHTAEESLTCYERLENMKERLPRSFHQCHKSYLVNMDYIRLIQQQGILLKTGEKLPVSKAKYADTRAAFFRYIGQTL